MREGPRAQGAPGRWRRLGGRALKGLGGTLVGVVLLVTLGLVFVASPPGRGLVCRQASAMASEAFAGEVEVGRCAALTLFRVRIEDAVVRSPEGAVVVSVGSITVFPDVSALLLGELRVREVVVTDPTVSLADEGGRLALVAAFAPAAPSRREAPPSEPGEGINLAVERARIEGGRVLDLPDGLEATDLAVEGSVRLDPSVDVTVRAITATVSRRGTGEVARLARLAGRVRLEPGTRSEADLEIRSGDDRVGLTAEAVWGESLPERVSAEARLALSPVVLERFGLSEAAAAVETRIGGQVLVEGALDDLTLRADLETDGGPLVIDGRLEGERVAVALASEGLELGSLATSAPEGRFSGRLSAALGVAAEGERPLEVEARDVHFREYELALLTVRGGLGQDFLRIASVEAPHLTGDDGRLDLTGRIGFDGSVDARLEAALPAVERDPNLTRLVEGVRGSLEAEAQVRLTAGDAPRLEAEGHAVLSNAAGAGAAVERAELRGWARGRPSAPEITADLTTTALRAGGARVRSAALTARGGPERYRIDGTVALPAGREVDLDVTLVARAGLYAVDGDVRARGLWRGPVLARLDGVVVDPAREVRIRGASLTGRGLAARAEGRYGLRGPSDLRATVTEVDLAVLDEALGLDQGLAGRGEGALSFGGTPESPELDARVEVRAGRVQELRLPRAAVTVAYRSAARSADIDAAVDLSADGTVRLRGHGALGRGRDPMARLRAGAWDLRAEAARLRLEAARQIAPDLPAIEGELAADLRIQGPLVLPGTGIAGPEAHGRVELTGVRYEELSMPRGLVTLAVSAGEAQTASLTTHAELGSGGLVELDAEVALGAGEDLLASLRDGTWDVRGTLRELPLSSARLVAPDLPPLEGAVTADLEAHGTVAAPEARLGVQGQGVSTPDLAPIDVEAVLTVQADALALHASARDERGELATLAAEAHADLAALAEGQEPTALLDHPWTLSLRVPERAIAELPVRLPRRVAEDESLPETVRADLTLSGGGGAATAGELRARAAWAALPEGAACRDASPAVRLTIGLQEGRTTARAEVELPPGEAAEAEVRAETPVDDWLRHGLPEALPELEADLRLDVPLEALPLVCSRASGRAVATGTATGLLGDTPRVDLDADVTDLRAGAADPVSLSVSGHGSSERATADVRMTAEGREALSLAAAVPLRWGNGRAAPELGEAPFEATLSLDRAPVAPLLVAVPGIEEPSGRLDGHLEARGRPDQVAVTGEVAFRDLGLTVVEPFQRVDHLDGRLRLTEDSVAVEGVRLRDGGGTLLVDGRVALEGWEPRRLELDLQADRFPVRNEGIVYLRATSRLRATADLGERSREVRVTATDTTMSLPDQAGHQVQALEQHPDVVYEDQPGFGPEPAAEARPAATAASSAPPLVLLVDATEPFWLRHTDFAMQLTAELRVEVQAGEPPLISGPLRIRRGFLSLLGKSFDLERGELTFAGGREVDPLVDITAVHTLRENQTVTVHIGGRLSDLTLTFSTTVPDATTEAEILALLVTGRAGDPASDIEGQAVSMLASVTAGLLSTIARREIGAFVPVLSLESQGATDTRLRAGFQADRLIPRALRGVIRGIYVEGFIGTRAADGEATDAAPAVTGGGAVELYFPHDLVTTGTYQEPAAWSVDLTWEP